MLLSTLSAISWQSGGLEHEAAFAIGLDNAVYMDKDFAGFVSLSGYFKQISAGLDASGNGEIYGIGSDNAVYVNDLNGKGWTDLGGNVTAISATSLNTVYAIGSNSAVYVNYQNGSGWSEIYSIPTPYPTAVTVSAISAGTDRNGLPMVYGLLPNGQVAVSGLTLGPYWFNQGGDYTAISATGDDTVFAIAPNGSVSMNQLNGNGWIGLGGTVKAISAGMDGVTGAPEVYVIGTNDATYVDENQKGWVYQGGYVTEISATANSSVFARGGLVTQVFVNSEGVGYGYLGSTPLANPQADTAYSPAPAGTPLFNNGTPSYLDVAMGSTGDCWLMASLAEAAARDPKLIENMFVYDGTTVDHGSTVGLYTVQFYSNNGTEFGVQVDTEFPSGGNYYDHIQTALGTSSLWAALAEKAYTEANTFGLVSTHFTYQDFYDALNGEDAANALHAITGQAAADYYTNTTSIVAAWNAGQLVVLDTTTPASTTIVPDHDYALVGYNASSTWPFEVFNPWGTTASGWAPEEYNGYPVYGLFYGSASFISQNFAVYSVGAEAAPGKDQIGPAILVPRPTDRDLAKPEKAAVVRSDSSRNDATAVRSFRPTVVAATGSEGLGVLDAVTPGSGASWSSRRLWAKRFGSMSR